MRQVIINLIVYGGMGAFLSYLGFPFTKWQFWVVIGGMAIIQLNSSL